MAVGQIPNSNNDHKNARGQTDDTFIGRTLRSPGWALASPERDWLSLWLLFKPIDKDHILLPVQKILANRVEQGLRAIAVTRAIVAPGPDPAILAQWQVQVVEFPVVLGWVEASLAKASKRLAVAGVFECDPVKSRRSAAA